MEVRTPSDGFAATFPKGDGFYPDKLKFIYILYVRLYNTNHPHIINQIHVL